MARTLKTVILVGMILLFAGCQAAEEKPIWEQVKIGQLAPATGGGGLLGQLLKTIDFNVYVFEIPTGKISVLDEIWPELYSKPFHFRDRQAFNANSFSMGFGQAQMWDKIGNKLRSGGAKKVETISMLLNNAEPRDLVVSEVEKEKTIFYIAGSGPMEGVTVGPGKIALRMKAEKIDASRGVCNLEAMPVFSPRPKGRIERLSKQQDKETFLFKALGFNLKMSPGDFLFLGPSKYSAHQATLASHFFSRGGQWPIVQVYLIICVRMVY